MSRQGRPIRFLIAVLGGWTALRVAALLPEAIQLPEVAASEVRGDRFAVASLPPPLRGGWPLAPTALAPPPTLIAPSGPMQSAAATGRAGARTAGNAVSLALFSRIGFGQPQRRRAAAIAPPLLPPPPPSTMPANAPRPSRLSGSLWLALREGGRGADILGPGGQIGGSQAGLRLRYAIDESRRVALSARLSGPMRGIGREAALGIEWRPGSAPVALMAEQRIALDGGRGGPAVMAVGGLDPRSIGGGFDLEGYAQGGAVLRGDRVEPFVDGALRLARPITRIGRGDVTLGLGAWGAAQRDAQRLDLGPSIAIALPVAKRNLRLSLDWRERVAGGARPGSGVALTLGTDF